MKRTLAAAGALVAVTASCVLMVPSADAQTVPPPGGGGCAIKVSGHGETDYHSKYHVTFSQTCGFKVKAFYHESHILPPTEWDYGNVRTTAGTSTASLGNGVRCSSGYEWSYDGKTWFRVPIEADSSACK